jgi:hypothetical protein
VDEEHLDLLASAGGHCGSRIRDEVLEEADVSWGGTNPDSAAAHATRATGRKHGRLIGLVLKLAGEGADDSVKQFGEKHGMEPKDAAEFHANHIRLPLPGAASDVLTGPLPGTDRQGELAWLEYSSAVDLQRNYNAVVVDTGRDLRSTWLDADDVTVPGFGEGIPERALELARQGAFGVSADGTKACVYRAMPPGSGGWPSGAEVEEFVPRALEIADAL